MYNDLPRFFSRDFATSYLLPSGLFLLAGYGIFTRFGMLEPVQAQVESDLPGALGLGGLLMVVLGLVMLLLNGDILRVLSGYGDVNPARLVARIERHNFQDLHNAIDQLDDLEREYEGRGEEFPPHLRERRNRLWHLAAERFPEKTAYLMPTAFGNTLRAFEAYGRVMYGLEGTTGWNRLLAVIPAEYRARIDGAKAQMDFWVNVWLLSIVMLILYIVLVLVTGHLYLAGLPIAIIIVIFYASWRARHAAAEWGGWVRGAYDVYIADLAQKLGLALPPTREAQRELWAAFSTATTYRLPLALPEQWTAPTPGPDDEA